MDKIAANNHFVVLRKEIKKAKAMVSGNLIRKINKHKQEKEKTEDEAQIKRLDDKINNILEEIRHLKATDSYVIAKKATLNPDVKDWEKKIGDSKADSEDRLTARVICKNNIQRQVKKFRTDHIDCDEWLNEYIEFREKKRAMTETSKLKRFRPKNEKVKKKDNKT